MYHNLLFNTRLDADDGHGGHLQGGQVKGGEGGQEIQGCLISPYTTSSHALLLVLLLFVRACLLACVRAYIVIYFINVLTNPTLARLRAYLPRRDARLRGAPALVLTHCHHSILCMRTREAPTANQHHYRDSTHNLFCLI